jgi:hypothetical protein
VTSGDRESERLTALGGLAALSLDALSSVAYGPEAILIVLVAAGTAGLRFSLPVTGAIIVLLAALVISYRQVIEAFPNGGCATASGRSPRRRQGPARRGPTQGPTSRPIPKQKLTARLSRVTPPPRPTGEGSPAQRTGPQWPRRST